MLVPSRAELPNRWATLSDIQAMTRSPPTHRDETLAHAAEIKSSVRAGQNRIGIFDERQDRATRLFGLRCAGRRGGGRWTEFHGDACERDGQHREPDHLLVGE